MKAKPMIGLIQFPGSNCERETTMAICRSGMLAKDIFWNSDVSLLEGCDGFIIVGGFSYEDRLRAGIIASLNPVIQCLKNQSQQNKPILGICNGAQILLESGLVPGLENGTPGAALYKNIREIKGRRIESGYYNDWCTIKPRHISKHHAFTNQFEPEQTILIPFAHGEGRFVLAEGLFEEICANQSSLFQYVGDNPNGSEHHLAAISNKSGNVMAMMPHPERCEAGDIIFKSMHAFIVENSQHNLPTNYQIKPLENSIKSYREEADKDIFLVDLLIEDKAAKSLELLLKQNNIDVTVERYQYWSIDSTLSKNDLHTAVTETAELFNTSKEKCTQLKKNALHYLVRDKDDVLGKQKVKTLQTRFNMSELSNISHGVVYGFNIAFEQRQLLINFLQKTHLLYNPYIQDCYEYHQ